MLAETQVFFRPYRFLVIIVEYVSYDSVLNHYNLVNIFSAKGHKRQPHIQLGDGFCIQFVPFYLSYVGSGKSTKTFDCLRANDVTESMNYKPKVDY